MPPVTAHPTGEVPIIVLIIVRNKRGKQPKETAWEPVCGALGEAPVSCKEKRTRLQPANDDPLGQTRLLLLMCPGASEELFRGRQCEVQTPDCVGWAGLGGRL